VVIAGLTGYIDMKGLLMAFLYALSAFKRKNFSVYRKISVP